MAIKLDYVARETATNLTRNVTLTLASILTVVVSLTLFGSAFMLNQGVNNANDRFKGGIEFIVFLQPESTQEQKDSMLADLEANPDVREVTYVDQDETYEEFKRIFEGQTAAHRDGVAGGPAAVVPRRARVTKDPEVVRALGDTFQDKAGRLRGGVRLRGGEGHPGDLQQDRRAVPASPPVSCCSPPACSSSTRSGWRCSPVGARSR